MVKPLNARSGSNQAVCGSVGEKQKVRTQPWVLAHSYHVSYERQRPKKITKRRKPRPLRQICFQICRLAAARRTVRHARRWMRIKARWRELHRKRQDGRQTHSPTDIDPRKNPEWREWRLLLVAQFFCRAAPRHRPAAAFVFIGRVTLEDLFWTVRAQNLTLRRERYFRKDFKNALKTQKAWTRRACASRGFGWRLAAHVTESLSDFTKKIWMTKRDSSEVCRTEVQDD